MPAIKSLTVLYDALNEEGTFSEGDTIRGKVTLALEKPTAVQSFFVKVKGDAEVRWTTRSGNHNHTHSARYRYFKLKHFLIAESANGRRCSMSQCLFGFVFLFFFFLLLQLSNFHKPTKYVFCCLLKALCRMVSHWILRSINKASSLLVKLW